MNTMIIEKEVKQEWLLSPIDRCDSCAAEALVRAKEIKKEVDEIRHDQDISGTPI